MAVLSANEKEFIIAGVLDDVRADGRGCDHVRHFSLRTGVVSNTNGSAKIERVREVLPWLPLVTPPSNRGGFVL